MKFFLQSPYSLQPNNATYRPAVAYSKDGRLSIAVIVHTPGRRNYSAAYAVLAGYIAQLMLYDPAIIDTDFEILPPIFHPTQIHDLEIIEVAY